MNLHMPQDPESESELKNLAAVPYQIISPANNSSIIGIYQDSMLGCYLFSRENIRFTERQAMNLLMKFDRVNEEQFKKDANKEGGITSYDILSQIMPPLSIKGKVTIQNGKYVTGQIDKGVLGGRTRGLLQRICNDFGNSASAKFIDDLQNIVTEYMKNAGFSVGISDLISNKSTNEEIIKVITSKKTEVKNLIDQVQLSLFENNTGKTNEEEFETQVNSILNQATSEAGKIGLKNLSEGNRFVEMVKAGSKGSDLNISFMISCLGQQNVDGKRIPYGFENRTLPHFTKYDDSPGSRGFVESSYINGLNPQELFMHAMGGRVGLIDTAVKTSTTGYIQRRLIKGLEDLMVNYDMTIRTNKNKIVQFKYGDDNIDTTKVEDQEIPIVEMSIQDLYNHYLIPEESGKIKVLGNIFLKNVMTRVKKEHNYYIQDMEELISEMIEKRKDIVKNVFKNKSDKVVNCPVAFMYIINSIQAQCGITESSLVDITLLDAYNLIKFYFEKLNSIYYSPPTQLFKTLFFYYLSPKNLLIVKRFNKNALTLLLEKIVLDYKRAIVTPGEMVGMIAGQSIGEVSTQMSVSYNTQHKLVIKDKITGEFKVESILVGKFIDELMEKYPNYTLNTGHFNSYETLLHEVPFEYYVQSVNKNETTTWSKLSHISRHPVNGEMIRVTTKSGRVVETTPSHSHLIRRQHRVVPITGFELKIGMRIPVCKSARNLFTKETISIGDDNKVLKMSSDFATFIGLYLASGCINKNNVISIAVKKEGEFYLKNIKNFMSSFNYELEIDNCKNYQNYFVLKLVCLELADLLGDTCGKHFHKNKKICMPEYVFTASSDFKATFIQTYMDNSGDFTSFNKRNPIQVIHHSKKFIKDLALLFNYFDIAAVFGSKKILGGRHPLIIPSKYLISYKLKIGTLLYLNELQQLVNCEIQSNTKNFIKDPTDKVEEFGKIIADCGEILNLKNKNAVKNYWQEKPTIGRKTLQDYYDVFSNHEKSHLIHQELYYMRQTLEAHIIWDEIVNIEYYRPNQNEFVYDFTVPGSQTFMTDCGIFVHNTLNTFHFAGVASKSNVTRGVPRIEEILSLSSDIKNPSLSVYLKPEDERQKEKAQTIMYMLEHTILQDIVKSTEICFDPDDLNTLIDEDKDCIEQYKAFENMVTECNEANLESGESEKSKWVIRMVMDPEVMLEKNITMDDVHFVIKSCYEDQVTCIYSDFNSDKLIFRIRMNDILKNTNGRGGQKKERVNPLDQSDQIYLLKNFQDNLLQKIVLRGISGISKVILRKILDNVVEINGVYKKQDIWVLDTIGTNLLDVLGLDYIDNTRTISNNIIEIYNVLGIEAARQAIYNELVEVVEFDGTYINFHNYSVLVDRMTFTHKLISIYRHGINNDNIGPIAKASFEETPEMFLKAARHAELDTMRGISANVMCGQEGHFGTSAFQVVLDVEEMQKLEAASEYKYTNVSDEIEKFLNNDTSIEDDKCGLSHIVIQNNSATIQGENIGGDNDYNPGF